MVNPESLPADQLAQNQIIPMAGFKLALPLMCNSGCDRIPLSVHNLHTAFFLSGFNDTGVFLTDRDTCMVSEHSYDDIELPTVCAMGQIQELVFAWMESAEGVASSSLAAHARDAARIGVKIPVTVRWPEGRHSRKGVLTLGSDAISGSGAQWIAAVETIESRNVVFRYGLSRIEMAMHDGKKLTMKLKPGTTY